MLSEEELRVHLFNEAMTMALVKWSTRIKQSYEWLALPEESREWPSISKEAGWCLGKGT